MYKYFKRSFDFVSAFCLLVVISPIFLVLCFLVRWKLGSPIFFKQIRTGKGMKEFKLIKFRSMSDERDKNGELLPDHLRVTRFGVFLRSSSLDELPELLNIIKGDMSVIGPRPMPVKYNEFYKKEELSRFNVRGGLISSDAKDGVSVVSWDRQLGLDAEYGNICSLKEDVVIFLSVFKALMKRADDNLGSFERVALNVERSYMKK